MHEASLVPTEQYHLYRWRMRGPHPWSGFRRRVEEQAEYIEQVYQRVVDEGPLVAGDLEGARRQEGHVVGPRRRQDRARGALLRRASQRRAGDRRDFARVYDLPERMIPAEALARPALSEHDARKELLVLAAKYHGIGTLARSGRLPPAHADPVQARVGRARRRRPPASPSPCASGTAPRTSIPTARRPRRVQRSRAVEPVRPGRLEPRRARCGCSGSTTASRSTRRPRSDSTATTCLPFLLGDDTRRPRRSQGRPRQPGAPRAERVGRAGGERARGRGRVVGGAAADGDLAGARPHRGQRKRRPRTPRAAPRPQIV